MKKKENKVFIELNKQLLFIEVCVVLFVFVILLLLSLGKDSSNKKLSKKKTIENNIVNIFFSDKKTKKDVEALIGNKIIQDFHPMGKDSYLRYKPNTSLLDAYDKEIDKYASIVEGKYLKTTYETYEDNEGNVYVKMKPWNFATYTSDVNTMTYKLFELANIDPEIYEKDHDKFEIYEYKARAKAMKILNQYLDDYDNKDEVKEMTFFYDGDKPEDNQYLSLYFNLVGVTCNSFKNLDTEKQDKKIDSYLKDAMNKGIINKKDPLGL